MRIIAMQHSIFAFVLLSCSLESVDSFSAGSITRCYTKTRSTVVMNSSSSSSSSSVVDDETAINHDKVEDANDHNKNKSNDDELKEAKRKLFGLLGKKKYFDPVLADPITKEPLEVSASGGIMGGSRNYQLVSSSNNKKYGGTSDTYLNLLADAAISEENNDGEEENAKGPLETMARSAIPFLVPPPLRQTLASAGLSSLVGDDYVPMRDLFTSPAVSFAYERGWRQNFATAGFPGPDNEAKMASEYFAPVISSSNSGITTLVDMSCATGLFTRRFAKSGDYDRVLGCDYSPSMLQEARRRINSEKLTTKTTDGKNTQLELVQLDVGQIPMQDNSVDVLHAGAAMHCWPDLPSAVSEIRRVLKPGGRYFATTFLSSYFRALKLSNSANGGSMDVSTQAFQYFESVEVLRDLLVNEGGFDKDKVEIELLKPAAIVIRCEK